MGLFKKRGDKDKKKGELPELPNLPELPELPESFESQKLPPELPEPKRLENKNLPSFPNQTIEDSNQEAGESAMNPIKPATPREIRTLEFPDFQKLPTKLTPPEIPESKPLTRSIQPLSFSPAVSPPISKKIEPVYIRIDKFKSAVSSFQGIQAKIIEIDVLLRKIKEQKQKEDEELRGWERELETIKARIDAIDKGIFSKLD